MTPSSQPRITWPTPIVKENGVPIGSLGDGEAIWHTDMNYQEYPPLGSALYAREVPPVGGDTGFCNMYKALDVLPADLRKRIEGLSIKHDASKTTVVYAGHDVNVEFIRMLLGATWGSETGP